MRSLIRCNLVGADQIRAGDVGGDTIIELQCLGDT